MTRLLTSDPINRQLKAWLPLNENAGLSAFNLVGPLSGRLTATTRRTQGWTTVNFDGSTTQGSLGLTGVNHPGAYSYGTISWWMRPASAYNSGTVRSIWGTQMVGGSGLEFACQAWSDGNWYIGSYPTGSRLTMALSATNYIQNVWTHYAVVWSPSGLSFYCRGQLIGSAGAQDNSATDYTALGFGSMLFSDASTPRRWDGDLAHFRVWRAALNPFAIKRLASDPWAGTVPLPHWRYSISGGTTYNETISDGVTVADSISSKLTTAGSVSDTITAADSTTGTLVMSPTITDSTTLADTPSGLLKMSASVSDGVTASDTPSATMVMGASVSDGITTSDGATGGLLFSSTISDGITAADSVSASMIFNLTISETIAALDSITNSMVLNATVSDGVVTADIASDGNHFSDTVKDGITLVDAAFVTVTPAPTPGPTLPSKRISALDPTVEGSAMPGDVVPVTQMTTGPNTGWTKKFPLSALAQGVGVGVNVLAFGAKGDGITDDTLAIQSALNEVSTFGGTVIFPPGTEYKISNTLFVSSNTQVIGYNARIVPVPEVQWIGEFFFTFANKNHKASAITDEYLTFEGLTIDYVNLTSSPDGSRHAIYVRKARNVRVISMNFLEGGDSVAFKATDDTLIQGCYAKGFKNCAWDHWEGPTNGKVIGNYAEATSYNEAQIMNWNPDSDAPIQSGLVASNFIATGNIFVSTDTVSTPIQIEPLRADSTKVRNVTFTGNTLVNCSLQMRGDIANAVVTGNSFSDTAGGGSVFNCYTFVGGTPLGVKFDGNAIANPTTSSGFGVIRHEGTTGSVIGNVVTGFSPANPAHTTIYTTSRALVLYGNQSSHRVVGVIGSMGNGDTMVANASVLGWWDTSGTRAKMRMTSGNNWEFVTADGSGNERNVLAIASRNGQSELQVFPGVRFSERQRIVGAVGVTTPAGGAGLGYQAQANFVQVTTCPVGGGLRLPNGGSNFITGAYMVIWNDGANTLTIYPQSGGSINGGAVDASITLAAGANISLYALTNLTWKSY